MKLSIEQEHLVLENRKLVHYLVQKHGVTYNSSEYEDIVSIGTIGLIKAAITFDTSKNIAFSTYASRCINNEIFMYYRKANQYVSDISLEEPIGNNGEGKEITLGDKIEDPESNFVEEILNKEDYIQLVSIVLNCLKGKQRIVFLYRMADRTQSEVAANLNISSRSYVSRIEAKAIQELKKIASQPVHYKEVFHVATIGDEYRISFSSKDIRKFNEIFATFLKNQTSAENLPDFKVNCNRERIIIQVPAHPESFSFIAEIIQKIDDFSMSFVSNKAAKVIGTTEIAEENDTECMTNGTHTVEDSKKIAVEVPNSEDIVQTSAEVKKIDETISDSAVKRESQAKQVRDYMLSMPSSFTVKDLRLHFPNMNVGAIGFAVHYAKSKGLITAISRGKYVVNKN